MPNEIKSNDKNFNIEKNKAPERNNYNTNEKNIEKEVDLPVPEKKNDDITTGINGEQPEKNTGQTGFKPEYDDEKRNKLTEKDINRDKGSEPEKKQQPERKDKRGDEPDRLERDDTTDPKTKDAEWQQDKMNEANNQGGNYQQTGTKQFADKAGKINDTRDDSILNPPKTETYEKKQGDNVGGTIKKDNYSHTSQEKKRDENNRKNSAMQDKKNKAY